MRKFIKGKYEGTNLEIMPSKPAKRLPNGTPIDMRITHGELSATQVAHVEGNIDVHARQEFTITDSSQRCDVTYTGPTIAQQWKAEYRAFLMQGQLNLEPSTRGWTARYYVTKESRE